MSELTKKFMDEHGKKKKAMKVSWNEYLAKMRKGQQKKESVK